MTLKDIKALSLEPGTPPSWIDLGVEHITVRGVLLRFDGTVNHDRIDRNWMEWSEDFKTKFRETGLKMAYFRISVLLQERSS